MTAAGVACTTTSPKVVQQTPTQRPVILTLGNREFTTDDLFQSFTKNQLEDSAQRTDIKQYVDLYTNLKLKVLAAEQQGRDTTEEFREEMATYRKQLAQSYLTDKALVEQLSAEAYQRMTEEVSAAHILTAVSADASPADTLTAYKTALALRDRLLKGEDFATLARQYSNDPTVAQNGGNLGYFVAFQTIYPLESAAYATPTGSVSLPVRTPFGYHLIQVNGRRASRGQVQVAHILVRLSPGATEAGQLAARRRIDEAYSRLQAGESFEAVCRDYSDDTQSKNAGGVLPFFSTNQNVPAFEEAAFSLTTPGRYTQPIRTNYGWHIIKLLARKPVEAYADLTPALRQKVTTDARAEVLRQATLQRLRKEYSLVENPSVVRAALAKADSSLLAGKWRYAEPLDATLQNKVLVTLGGKPQTVNSFFAYVRRKQQPRPATVQGAQGRPVPAVAMQHLYDRFVGDQLLDLEEASLDTKYPEFRSLLTEVRDGVLLSQVMEDQVWERSLADSVGQRRVYEQNKATYRYPERAVATVLTAPSDQLLQQARQMLAGKAPYQLRRSAPDLNYEPNQTQLAPKGLATAFDVLVALTKNPNYRVEVAGSRAASERDTVSAGRIRTLVNYLVSSRIPLSRIMEKDYGAYRPGTDPRRVTFQYFSTAKDDVARVLSKNDSPEVSILEGAFAKGMNASVDAVEWKPGTAQVRHVNGKSVLVQIATVEPARQKTFDEARGSVVNAYQAQLEKQWLAQLRQQFPVKVNEAEMRKLVK